MTVGRVIARFAPVLLLLGAWQLATDTRVVDPAFLPSVSTILVAVADLLQSGEIEANLFISLFRSFAGLALATLAGVSLGAVMAVSARADGFFGPLVAVTYSLPKSALIPLFLLWFGIGSLTDITAVFLACLLPVLVHTYHGVKGTPRVLVWSAQAMGTSRRAIVVRVMLPAALPSILTGLRIALGFSFVLTISAEMIASTDGIGKLIFMYGENGAYAYMFAAIGVVVAVAYIADRLLLALNGLILRWHEGAHQDDDARV